MTDLIADWLATATRPPRADFFDDLPGDHLTDTQYAALLTEEEAHAENQQREERAA